MSHAPWQEYNEASPLGLCSLGSEVPPGFGVGGAGESEAKCFFFGGEPCCGHPVPPPSPLAGGDTWCRENPQGPPGKIHRVPRPAPPHLCICFPAVSVTSMPFSICFTSFPGPLTPAKPGRKEEGADGDFKGWTPTPVTGWGDGRQPGRQEAQKAKPALQRPQTGFPAGQLSWGQGWCFATISRALSKYPVPAATSKIQFC